MKDLKIVKEILERHYNLDKNETYIFGSRARGNHREDSDLDILIIDNDISAHVITRLEEEFEESNLLYKVDLVLRSRIDDSFYNKIKDQLTRLSV